MVAGPLGHIEFQQVAHHGREDRHHGHPAVAHPATGEEAEGVEAQERSVGEARHVEDDGDEGVVMEWPEGYNDEEIEEREGDVDDAAYS